VHSFAVCDGLIRLHGGFLKLTRSTEGAACIEVEIPLAAPEVMGSAAVPRATPRPATPLTALVLEPDPEARQTLVSALSDFGHRSVTAASAEEATELVKRLRFDILFCSSLVPGAGWPACFENSRAHVRSFVVLTRGPDPALAAALPAGEARALAKPVRPDELSRLLEETEARGR
jgi:CheY-like chemotaxis protein